MFKKILDLFRKQKTEEKKYYKLVDEFKLAKKYPMSIWVFEDEAFDMISKWDQVKLRFDNIKGARSGTERMRVEILSINWNDQYVGYLKNDPVTFPKKFLKYWDKIEFSNKNILDINFQNEELNNKKQSLWWVKNKDLLTIWTWMVKVNFIRPEKDWELENIDKIEVKKPEEKDSWIILINTHFNEPYARCDWNLSQLLVIESSLVNILKYVYREWKNIIWKVLIKKEKNWFEFESWKKIELD